MIGCVKIAYTLVCVMTANLLPGIMGLKVWKILNEDMRIEYVKKSNLNIEWYGIVSKILEKKTRVLGCVYISIINIDTHRLTIFNN